MAAEEIRQREKGTGRHTPIIGVTAHAVAGDREKCLDAGMDDYMPKPINPDQLIAKVDEWLKKSPASDKSANAQEQRRRVLCVDDNDFNQKVLMEFLIHADFAGDHAGDGKDALQNARTSQANST